MPTGRNDPCPCGSGKKYKHCHAKQPDELPTTGTWTGSRTTTRPKKHRQCRECRACCGLALHINEPDLVVRKGELCPHLCQQGCSRWGAGMPELCRNYMCSYMVEPGRITVAERPDKIGAIVQRKSHEKLVLAECAPGGLLRVLRNRVWGPMVVRNLRRGARLEVSFCEDPHNAEKIYVQPIGQRLKCELAVCEANGAQRTVPIEPIYGQPLLGPLFLNDSRYVLDVEELLARLGQQDAAMIVVTGSADMPPQHFRLTRRQGEFLRALLATMATARDSTRPAAVRVQW